jgi:outer membrane immunogenic protein
MKFKSLLSLALLAPAASFALSTPGAYVQGAIGGTAIFTQNDYSFSSDVTPTTLSGQLAAGYLWGCDSLNYGLELGYLYYPSAKINLDVVDANGNNVNVGYLKIDGTNLDLLGVLKYNFDNGFNVFAKAGAAYVDQKIKVKIPVAGIINASVTDHKVAPEVALGVGYQFDQNWGINFTVNTVFAGHIGDDNKAVSKNGSALVGVSYRFA